MRKHSIVIGLSCLLLGLITNTSANENKNVSADASPDRWSCYRAPQARQRQHHVMNGFLPAAVIDGETLVKPVSERMHHYRVPAMSVAVIHKGQLDWSAARGQLYVGGTAATCSSLFQAGSIAKPVTVLAALRMKEQGVIDWDKDIETYLTSYHLPMGKQTPQNPVTLRNVLAHTSGITPGGFMGYDRSMALPTDLQTVRGEAPSNARKVEVLTEPNRHLRYSGGAYTVAEIALQDQFKRSFDELMQQWIIVPFGLRQATFLQPLPAALHDQTARGHTATGTVVPGGWNTHPEQAAAGLWATASDLAQLLIELRRAYRGESQHLSQASVRELLATPIDEHAYGFRLLNADGQTFIVHYGGTVGYNAGMAINLESGEGAAYLINSLDGSNLGQEFFAAVSREYRWPIFREDRFTRVAATASQLQALVGRYEFSEQGWKVDLVYEHDALTIVFPNGDRYALTPIAGESLSFVHQDTGVQARVISANNSVELELYGQKGRRTLVGP